MKVRLRLVDIPIEAGGPPGAGSSVVVGQTTARFEGDVEPPWTEIPGSGDRLAFIVEIAVGDDDERERQLVLKVRGRTWLDLGARVILELEPEPGYKSLDLIPWWRGLVTELGLVESERQRRERNR